MTTQKEESYDSTVTSTKTREHSVIAIIDFSIHKREEKTKQYVLTDFNEDDQKIIFNTIESIMHDYATLCKDETQDVLETDVYYAPYERYPTGRFDELEEGGYEKYCNGYGYARSRVEKNNMSRKELKIHISFKNCDPKKINHRIATELVDGFFSNRIRSAILSDGEYVLIPGLKLWKGCYGIVFAEDFEKN